jgi:DNA-binding response OmpR family regulator
MNARVLVVDDDADLRRFVRTLLENAGFTVAELSDGRAALAETIRLRPDLVLIDWVMPGLDGCAATAQLKRDPQTAHIPVIMMSGKLTAADRIDALAAGVGDFIDKPFHSGDLLATVRRHIRLHRAPAPLEPASAAPPEAGVTLELDELTARADGAAGRREYEAAAAAYSLAAEAAAGSGDSDGANKLLRLAGKMRLLQAEASADPTVMHDAYRAAARFFLAAGNLSLATQANAAAKAALGRAAPP